MGRLAILRNFTLKRSRETSGEVAILPCDPEREATGEGARGERGLEQRWGAGCP